VHALLLQVGQRLVAVDTASTNGTLVDGTALARVAALEDGSTLTLGCSGRLGVVWRACGRPPG
jgi:pSer/pThr/pTyr-binding forkhead associated (FHA) protein